MKDKKDNFSRQAATYASFRPGYPEELYDFIYQHCNAFDRAWDCATGNGQAAVLLAEKFKEVQATDISKTQIEHAVQHDNITYTVEEAERTSFVDDSFDLVTIAQALHWLDHDKFYKEVKRVGKNNALFAAWGYNLPQFNEQTDAIIHQFYHQAVGNYWDEERKHVDTSYKNITFPFEPILCPDFSISYEWNVDRLLGYLRSWSAVQHHIRDRGTDPVTLIEEGLKMLWGSERHTVTFPIFMKLGKIIK